MTVRLIRRYPGSAQYPLGLDAGRLYDGADQDYLVGIGAADRNLAASTDFGGYYNSTTDPVYDVDQGSELAAALAAFGAGVYTRAVRAVGTRSKPATASRTSPNLTGMFQFTDFLRESMNDFQMLDANIQFLGTTRASVGGALSLQRDVENLVTGEKRRVTWNGSSTLAIAANNVALNGDGSFLWSDPMAMPAGPFRLNTYGITAGTIFPLATNTLASDLNLMGAAVPNSTMGTWTGNTSNLTVGLRPLAMRGTTSYGTVVQAGDSMTSTQGNTLGVGGYGPLGGLFAPSLAPGFNILDFGVPSSRAVNWATIFPEFAALLPLASHGILAPGYNDIWSGISTGAQTVAARDAIMALAPYIKWTENTIPMQTTSSDSWATVPNQTVANAGREAEAVAANLIIRGRRNVVDTRAALESTWDSGKFTAPTTVNAAVTADGIHPNDYGYTLVKEKARILEIVRGAR